MSIIISQNGKNAKRIDPANFGKENYLQQYIYENPESIPLYEIKEDIRLLILKREFPTDSGPIDALGIDKDGEIYLIETKLYKNPDKRLVVAQVMDYGASIWRSGLDFNQFVSMIEESISKNFKINLNQKLTEFFDLEEEEIIQLLKNIERNLNDGKFKFVVLMDKLHDQLKDLIVYINENSKFDIFAVELEYYKYESFEILIPKLFGAEVKKDIEVASARQTKSWDEENFFVEAKNSLSNKEFLIASELYEFFKDNFAIKFGTGITCGSFIAQITYKDKIISLLKITTKGKIKFYLSSLAKRGVPIEIIKNLAKAFESVDSLFRIEGKVEHSQAVAPIKILSEPNKLQKIKEIVLNFQNQLRK